MSDKSYERNRYYDEFKDFELYNNSYLTNEIKNVIEDIASNHASHREKRPEVHELFQELYEDIQVCPREYVHIYKQVASDFYKVAHMKSYIKTDGFINKQKEQYLSDDERNLLSEIYEIYYKIMDYE